jgi:orotidine-5'-phosphate decarboxylase
LSARIIVALDVPRLDAARALVDSLGDGCDFYKVGSELFTAAGPSVVEWLRGAGKEVFLDLKLHDIPNTVRGAARSAASLGVSLLTVHASGGGAMIAAAVEGAGDRTGVLGVTVLTSLDSSALGVAWGREAPVVADEVLRLAGLAAGAGAHGIVCSGREAALVRARYGDSLALLVPGIRLPGGPVHDQARSVTPAEAARAGARYLVLGRVVTEAGAPRKVVEEVKGQLAMPLEPTL